MAFSGAFVQPFQPAFGRGGAARNGLLNNLIAYWPLDEASGDALDAHTNGLTLTDANTVTNAVGKVYATARQYTVPNDEKHYRLDDAYLSTGDVDFTLAAWCYLDNLSDYQPIFCRVNTTAEGEFWVRYQNTGAILDRFAFDIYKSSASVGSAVANNLGAVSSGVWYFIIAWHDSVADTVNIQVNNGTPNTAATSGAPADTSVQTAIGAFSNNVIFFNGRIGPVAFWKSAAGAGGALDATKRTALYNAGAGLAYSAFTT